MQPRTPKIWKRRGSYYSLVCECSEETLQKKLEALQSAFPQRDYVWAYEQPQLLSVALH